MDIEGLGELQVQRFLTDGLITSVADLYDLSEAQIAALRQRGVVG